MKSKIEIIPYEEIIQDIAGNLFIIKIYYDLDGNIKREIKPYNPKEEINKQIFKNKNNNITYNYISQ